MRGKPKPRDVEEKGEVGEDGAVVEASSSKAKGKGKKAKKTVKEAEEEEEGGLVNDQMHGLEVEEQKTKKGKTSA